MISFEISTMLHWPKCFNIHTVVFNLTELLGVAKELWYKTNKQTKKHITWRECFQHISDNLQWENFLTSSNFSEIAALQQMNT